MSATPIVEKELKPAWDWPDYGSAADRDRERTPGMTDEWTDDDPPSFGKGVKRKAGDKLRPSERGQQS